MRSDDRTCLDLAPWARWAAWLTWLYLLGCFLIVCFALPWAYGLPASRVLVLGTGLLVLACLAYWLAPRSVPAPRRLGLWCGVIVVSGVVLRVAWIVWIPPVQLSDMAQYIEIARELLAGHGYYAMVGPHRLAAFRPPGESFLLAAVMTLSADRVWTPALLNLVCYIGSALLIHDLLVRLAGAAPALIGNLLFAIWPCGIMVSGLAVSEVPALFFWLTVLWALIRATDGRWRWPIISGLSAGAGILIRPSELLLPFMLLIYAFLHRAPRTAAIARAALIGVIALLVVAPWSVRNYLVFGSFVAVSTNGGDNLYRANNPLATGGFAPRGEQDFDHLLPDEIAWNRASSAAAYEWIERHPRQFIRLSFRKLAISLGADDTGAYWALERAYGIRGPLRESAQWLSNIWWFLVWALAAAALLRRRMFLTSTTAGLILMWFVIYFLIIHSIYESQPRYHLPAVGPLLVLTALAFANRAGAGANMSDQLHHG